jgi:DNA-binding MarR family transcriptional regulator
MKRSARRGSGRRAPGPPVLPCACANLRRAARAASQIYDASLRDADLTIAQFTILQVLDLVGERTQGDLGRILVLDSTTLTRTLATLERRGWIRRRIGKDRRERRVALTRAGKARFLRARPAWNRAQQTLLEGVGRRRWSALAAELAQIAGLAGRP